MWLLSTDRAELHQFNTPEDVPGGYAILSHVWGKGEQLFQDTEQLRVQCAATGANPRDLASPKVRESCLAAERDGFRFIWNDTCCIDKRSSAELSEDLNSMFRYYALADVCYAYLADVPGGCAVLDDPHSTFRKSRWHERGWTLQELIAPSLLIFLAQDWSVLGTKWDFAGVLEEITRIPVPVLKMEKPFSDYGIAQRMSWAAARKTTKGEDEAYSLMGLFSIKIPVLYGEGRQAFQRLQEEIVKKDIDASLFAWDWEDGGSRDDSSQSSMSVQDHKHKSYLFAASPSDFRECKAVSFNTVADMTSQERWWFDRKLPHDRNSATRNKIVSNSELQGLPSFSISPYGVLAHVPIFEYHNYLIAVLFCHKFQPTLSRRQPIGLLLTPCPGKPLDPARPLYYVGTASSTSRTTVLETDDIWHGRPAAWKDVYIVHRPSPDTRSTPTIPMNCSLHSPFRFPERHLQQLSKDPHSPVRLASVTNPLPSSNERRSLALTFEFLDVPGYPYLFTVHLGTCTSHSKSGIHWASVESRLRSGSFPSSDVPSAICSSADHICDWPHLTRTFQLSIGPDSSHNVVGRHMQITLSFTPFALSSAETLVVQMRVKHEDYNTSM